MHPLPKHLTTMPNPCEGVPAQPVVPVRKHRARLRGGARLAGTD